jgi:hypothetical protein
MFLSMWIFLEGLGRDKKAIDYIAGEVRALPVY